MAERRRRGSVRVRITVAVAVLFGLALTLAGVGFVAHLQRTLVDEVHTDDSRALEELRAQYERGTPPSSVLPVPARRPSTQVQVQLDDGRIVAATPGAPARAMDPRPAPRGPIGPDGKPLLDAQGRPVPPPRPGGADDPYTAVVGDGGSGELALTALPVSTSSGSGQLVATTPLDSVRASVDALSRALLVSIPVLVGLIALAAWWITGVALRPVGAMTARVEEITASTLNERVPVPGGEDEIAHLARTMNAMLERLEASVVRQRQFVSDASHELRSPVATIRTELEVAQLHPDRTDWDDVARNVLLEDERLERVVADLLVLARLDEEPGLDPRRAPEVDLDAVVQAEAARARRLPVDVHLVGPAKVRGRADELTRLVGHLLDNAARHATSAVSISLVAVPGSLITVLAVDDDGPGIPEDQRAAVFERFGRLEEGRSRDRGGAGLGLAVVRRIAERHGGSVQIATSPLGGARLIVDLPSLETGGGTASWTGFGPSAVPRGEIPSEKPRPAQPGELTNG